MENTTYQFLLQVKKESEIVEDRPFSHRSAYQALEALKIRSGYKLGGTAGVG